MTRKRRIAISVIVIGLVGALFVQNLLRGKRRVYLTEFETARTYKVEAPALPFRTGRLAVIGESDLSEPMVLTIRSNYGRHIEQLSLPAGVHSFSNNDGERWVNNLELIVPASDAKGTLKLLLLCGRSGT